MTNMHTSHNKGPKRTLARALVMIEALETVIKEPKKIRSASAIEFNEPGIYTAEEVTEAIEALKLAKATWGAYWLLTEKPALFRGAYDNGWWTLLRSIVRTEAPALDAILIGHHADGYDPTERAHSNELHKAREAFERAAEAKGKTIGLAKKLEGSIHRYNVKAKEGAAK